MKTLHVLDQSAPIVAGYTSRARSIVASQAEAGIVPIALTGVRQGPSDAVCEEIDGVRHYRTRAVPFRSPGFGEILEMAALARRVVEVAKIEAPDVIHAHSPVLCGLPGYGASRWIDAASVYEIRAFWEDAAVNRGRVDEHSAKYRTIRSLETWLARSVDALVVICEGLRRDLVARGIPSDRIYTVPNGVDARRFAPQARDEDLVDRLGFRGKTVIAYLGTFFRFEGIPRLLEALNRLTREDDGVRGLIVGYGETESEVRSLHSSLGLGRRVIMTGRAEAEDVKRYYGIADILCYPRERHRITELTTPLKPLEAMSMGKAVLGSSVGGISELVTDGETGLLFQPGDVDDLVRALRRLVADPILRHALGDRARRHVLAHRDWSALARRYLDVYGAALEHRHARRAKTPSFEGLLGLKRASNHASFSRVSRVPIASLHSHQPLQIPRGGHYGDRWRSARSRVSSD